MFAGFWLSKYLADAQCDAVEALYGRLRALLSSGRLVTKIDSAFQTEDIKIAVRRASTPGIDSKVMVAF